MLNVNEFLDVAKAEISKLVPTTIFLLRDSYEEYEWNRIVRSDGLLLGALFLNYLNFAHLKCAMNLGNSIIFGK